MNKISKYLEKEFINNFLLLEFIKKRKLVEKLLINWE